MIRKYKKIIIGFMAVIGMIAVGVLLWPSKDAPEVSAGWWNDNWSYRKQIVINSDYVTGDLTDFPVLISFTDTSVASHTQATGGDIVFVDQFIDRTTKREQSFYTKEKVCHISVAEPMCPNLRKNLIDIANNMTFRFHEKGTYVCIEGPRFSTKAESKMFRGWNADVIGMTLVPECVLAREAELCYASISTITDYDVWKDHPVSAGEVAATMKANAEKLKLILLNTIKYLPETSGCKCRKALTNAFL